MISELTTGRREAVWALGRKFKSSHPGQMEQPLKKATDEGENDTFEESQ